MKERMDRLNDSRSKVPFVTINKQVKSEMKTTVSHTKQIEIEREQIKIEKEEALKRSQVLRTKVTQNKNRIKELNTIIKSINNANNVKMKKKDPGGKECQMN